MPAPGALSVGRPVSPATGSAQVVLPRSGQLLGFFAGATGTVVLYDASSASNLPTAILASVTIPAVGWYPFPVDLVNGLVATCSAQTTFIIT
jgi:hypothetical protein